MSEGPDNLMLRILRSVDTKLDRMVEDLHDLKVRTTSVEEGLAGINRRLDRMELRLAHIEQRLDLTDAT